VVNMVMNGVVALTIDPVVVDLDPYSVVELLVVIVVVGIVRAVEVVEVLVATVFLNFSCRALVVSQARKFQSSGRLVSDRSSLWTHDAPRILAGLSARIGVFRSFGASKMVDRADLPSAFRPFGGVPFGLTPTPVCCGEIVSAVTLLA
jgi:hypothetical protein